MYAVHIALAYISVFAGAAALVSQENKFLKQKSHAGPQVTRIFPQFQWLHVHFGRTWMMTMYFTAASSLLIYTTGLPRSIIGFMTIMYFSKTISFGIIRFAQARFAASVVKKADEIYAKQGGAKQRPSEIMEQALIEIVTAPKTWRQRFFSLKAAHGYLMTLSWFMMAGRLLVTNPATAWNGCWTYPAIKDVTGSGKIELVPADDPTFFRDEMAFFLPVAFGSFISIAVIGLIWSVCAAWRQAKPEAKTFVAPPSSDYGAVKSADSGFESASEGGAQ